MTKSYYTAIQWLMLKKKINTISIFFGFSLTFFCFSAFAQDNLKEKTPEKSSPRISLVSTQLNGDSILLEASVKVKRDGSWQPVDFETVTFSVRNDSVTKPLGESLTSDKGVASLKVGINQLITGEDGLWNFGSIFKGNAFVNEGEAEVSIAAAGITLTGEKQDTTYSLTLRLFISGEEKLPLTEVEVGFYVKRHFSNLKIGEGTTDENGEVTITCPTDLPGDFNGNILLIGKAEDLEEYGSVAASIEKPWGIPIKESETRVTRSLSSHAPPLWMVIVFAILMSTVWGHYIVIVYKLIKLRNQKI